MGNTPENKLKIPLFEGFNHPRLSASFQQKTGFEPA